MSTQARRLLLNLVTALAILLALEGWCRMNERGSKYRLSELLGYELVPGYRGRHERVNAAGLRGAELRPRREGTLRILAMGGSTTWGHKIDDDETWPVALQRHLQRAGLGDVEVLNGGVSGWGLEQIVRALDHRYLRELKPDLVLVYSGWNRAVLKDNPHLAKYLRYAAAPAKTQLVYRLALARWLARKLDVGGAVAMSVDRDARRRATREIMQQNFPQLCRDLVATCARHNTPVVLIRYPALAQMHPPADGPLAERYAELLDAENGLDDLEVLWAGADQQIRAAHATILEAAAGAGLAVLDVSTRLLAGLPAGPDGARLERWMDYFRDRMHLTARGNEAIGAVLAELLFEQDLIGSV